MVSTEDGLVRCFDARQLNGKKDAIYTIHAHDSAVSSLDTSSHVDGLLVTGGADKMVKVWDVREGETKGCLASRDLGVVNDKSYIKSNFYVNRVRYLLPIFA